MKKISILNNPIQEYVWGSKTEIQHLIGQPESTDKPMAELWMGAHPKAPSQVLIDGDWQALDKAIEEDPEPILGKNIARRFSNQLPFLFKILAADRPLSVQVHPNLEQAKNGFSRENKLGTPINAPNRNYRDANHKPEILCALKTFQGLHGFRKMEEILELTGKLSISTLSDELAQLKKKPASKGVKTFFSALMTMDKTRQKEVARETLISAEKFANKEPAFHWVVELNREYPMDIGILSPVILNLVQLDPGEAIYLPAGELHAYLHGLGIELMASSDNVLRGGLTPKHIDVFELLNIVEFKTGAVSKVKPESRNRCQTVYETPAKEFQLSMISVNEGNPFISLPDRSVEILICLEGKADVEDLGCGEIMSVARGKSFIVPSEIPRYRIDGNAMLYMASVPF